MEIAIVYPVAGMSSRFGGEVKQLIKVGKNQETLIELSLKQAIRAGFNKIVFIVGQKTEDKFKELFGNEYNGVPIVYTKQVFDPKTRDKPWGTTDALLSIKGAIDCPFGFANGDDLYGTEGFIQLYNALAKKQNVAVGYNLFETLPDEGKVNRGTFVLEGEFVVDAKENLGVSKQDLLGLNKDAPANMNLFGFQPEFLDILQAIYLKFRKEHEGDRKVEGLLVDDVGDAIKNHGFKLNYYQSQGKWIGVTRPEDEPAVKEFLTNNPDYIPN